MKLWIWTVFSFFALPDCKSIAGCFHQHLLLLDFKIWFELHLFVYWRQYIPIKTCFIHEYVDSVSIPVKIKGGKPNCPYRLISLNLSLSCVYNAACIQSVFLPRKMEYWSKKFTWLETGWFLVDVKHLTYVTFPGKCRLRTHSTNCCYLCCLLEFAFHKLVSYIGLLEVTLTELLLIG